jgi:hypothetical protein
MKKLAWLLMFLACFGWRAAGQENAGVAPPRKSDTFETDDGRRVRIQHGELAKGNFQIAGVDLASEEDIFKQAARILGSVETRETGDASESDERACYRPIDKSDATRLYFHAGEVGVSFVLSSTTPASERDDVCRPSNKVARDLKTASGLHLGQTEEQVIAILGLPTRRSHNAKTGFDSMAYEYETKKRSSASDLANARKAHPRMSEQELMDNYGFYFLSESIEMKFAGGSMTELRVSWMATD